MILTKETCGYNLGSPNPQVTLGEGLSQEVIRTRKQSYPFVARIRNIFDLIYDLEKETLPLEKLFSLLSEYRQVLADTNSPEPAPPIGTNGTTAHLPDKNS